METMETGQPKNPDDAKANLLEKINTAMANLGIKANWRRAPEFKEIYLSLKGKKVVMVDDLLEVLKSKIPDLMVATDGNASFIRHTGQELNELVQQILANDPDIILMDYNLAGDLKGTEVVKRLKEQNFAGIIVGFSSGGNDTEFQTAGAIGSIDKSEINSVEILARLLSK